MSRTRFQAKQNGRRILWGKWPQAMFITLLVLLLSFGVSKLEDAARDTAGVPLYFSDASLLAPNLSPASIGIAAGFAVLGFLVMTPLRAGQAEWYWQLAGRKPNSVGNVFGWLGSLRLAGRSLALSLRLLWRLALWALLIFALPAALTLAGYYGVGGGLAADTMLVAGVLLCAAGAFVYLRVTARYFLARYLLVEDLSRGSKDCVRGAVADSCGFRGEIFRFELSFILWLLLCELVFPMFYVNPYYNASSAVLAQHVIFTARARHKKDKPGGPAVTEPAPVADESDSAAAQDVPAAPDGSADGAPRPETEPDIGTSPTVPTGTP